MITPSRLVPAAVLSCATAAIFSLLPPVTSAVAAQATVGPAAVAKVPASSPGVLAGTVRALGGPGLPGVCVTATGPAGSVHGFTTVGGRYFLSGLPQGEYRVGFAACAQPGRYLDQRYGQPVLVAPGRPTVLSLVTLRPVSAMAYLAASARAMRAKLKAEGLPATGKRPQLSGTVTDSAGHALAGICVSVLELSSGGAPPDGIGLSTGRNGTYRFPAGLLDPGRYKINFSAGCRNSGNFAPQWWKNAPTENKATILHVKKDSHFTGINGRLRPGASISGTVTAGGKSGPGLPGVCVTADGRGAVSANEGFAVTRKGGKYLITGLGTGRYTVRFAPGCGSKGSFADSGHARVVSVTDGKITRGVDGFLVRAGEVSGTVTTKAHHAALRGICVEAETGDGEVTYDARSGPAGRYVLRGVRPGRYIVAFAPGCGSKGSFAPQLYRGQISDLAGNPVVVKRGEKVGGIDAAMRPGGVVTGTVTNAAGRKLTGVCVLVARQADDGDAVIFTVSGLDAESPKAVTGGVDADARPKAMTGGLLPFGAIGITVDGRYRVTDLQPGNYSVSFSSGCKQGEPVEASQWFSPQGDDNESLVTIPAGPVRGVNAKLPAPGTITGVVTGPSGKPVAGVCAIPVGLNNQPPNVDFLGLVGGDGNPAESNSHGVYRLNALAAGKYGVEFLPCDSPAFAFEWYRQAGNESRLTPVPVRPGHVTAGINEQMISGQSISGRITTADRHRPVADACVSVRDSAGNFVSAGLSNKKGNYTARLLAPGTYRLQVGPCGRSVLATVVRPSVRVGSSDPVSGLDVDLPVAGKVTGRVTGGRPGRAVGGICVTATAKTGRGVPSAAFTAFDGRYSIGGLAPGKYRVEFSSQCDFSPGGFVSQWFKGRGSRGRATLVGVGSGKTVTAIDASLAADGAISGSVRVSGSPRAGVCVLAFRKTGGKTPTVAVSDAKGRYLIGGLSPGRYVIEFTGGCGVASYHPRWFDGASSRGRATPVAVKAGSVAAGINAR